MAAVLRCGTAAALSHESAAAAWAIRTRQVGSIEISIPARRGSRDPGIRVHRRWCLTGRDVTLLDGIRITSPALTLVDLGARLRSIELEAAINEADKRDLISPEVAARKA